MMVSQPARGVWFLLLFFLPGLLFALWLGSLRAAVERQDKHIETILDFDEIRRLAREEGWSLDRVAAAAVEAGASSLGISEDTLDSLEAEGRISVMTSQEVLKLSLEDQNGALTVAPEDAPGALWLHSRSSDLLDRIEQNLFWKLPSDRLRRLDRQMLLVNKSSADFRSRVGLGFSPEYLELAARHGLGVVLRVFNFPGLSASATAWLVTHLPQPASVSALLFAEEEVLGNRGDLSASAEVLEQRSYRLAVVEFNDQGGMDHLIERLRGRRPFVRLHSISRKELTEIYTVPRALARFERAVRDRRLRTLYVRCFLQDRKKLIGDQVLFNLDYLHQLRLGLENMGFTIARTDDERRHEPRHQLGILNPSVRFLIGLSLLLGLPLLLASMQSMALSFTRIALFAGSCAGMYLILPTTLFTAIAGLVGAITFSATGCIWAIRGLCQRHSPGSVARQKAFLVDGAWFIGRLLVPSLLGGLLLVGLHAESVYLLKFQQFRGIKIAFIAPLIITTWWAFRNFGTGVFRAFSQPLNLGQLLLLMVVGSGVTLYLLRSGNVTFLKPSALEDHFRTFLEVSLWARPRNKEFLIGYPAALFFVACFRRGRGMIAFLPLLTLLMQMGQVSVVNTFCHFHSPLALGLLRCFNGLWLGLLVGVVGLWLWGCWDVLKLLSVKKNRLLLIGYFGFDNFGDELLWRLFVREIQEAALDLDISVLYGPSKQPRMLSPAVKLVSRANTRQLLEEIAGSRQVAIPGGGVLQSATSNKSLWYYLLLLTVARLTGTRLIMPAQGLGPWSREDQESGGGRSVAASVNRWLMRYLLSAVDYISLRDVTSCAAWQEMLPDIPAPSVSADLAFLLRPTTVAGHLPEDGGNGQSSQGGENAVSVSAQLPAQSLAKPRIGVCLRGDVASVREIAGIFLDLEKAGEIDVVALVAQPALDLEVWGENRQAHILDATAEVAGRSALQELDMVFSMRLHVCILAAIHGLPWMGIVYDPKIEGFAQQIGWVYTIAPDELDQERLITVIRHFQACHDELRSTLRKKLEPLHTLAKMDVINCLPLLDQELESLEETQQYPQSTTAEDDKYRVEPALKGD